MVASADNLNQLFQVEAERLRAKPSWKAFTESEDRLGESIPSVLPFDPRFNAVHWSFDVVRLMREVAFGLSWMRAYACYYRSQNWKGQKPANVDFRVSYYADSTIGRLDSCRDKLALMVWAYYVPFDPDIPIEVIDYSQVMSRLEYPLKYGMALQEYGLFLDHLTKLRTNEFKTIRAYRDAKVHRREPRIEMFGVMPHHDWSYMVPLLRDDDIAKWKEQMEAKYPEPKRLTRLIENCRFNGVLYEERKLTSRLWDYAIVEKVLTIGFFRLLKVVTGCLTVLRQQEPLAGPSKRGGP